MKNKREPFTPVELVPAVEEEEFVNAEGEVSESSEDDDESEDDRPLSSLRNDKTPKPSGRKGRRKK